jgi:cobalt-zinc-cadmium efflux system outer membrane protein
MTRLALRWPAQPHRRTRLVSWSILCTCLSAALGQAAPTAGPTAGEAGLPCPAITLEAAVVFALRQNPELAAIRQQHGIAAAGVVIARTYPFNPVAQSAIFSVKGEPGLKPTKQQHQITLEVEVRGQRGHRTQAALAAMSRTDWDIASQEITFAVNTVRAFDNLLYRQGKLAVTEEFLRLNQRGAEQVKLLVERGTLRAADLILARAEVSDVQTQVGLNRTAMVSARRDFLSALGLSDGNFVLHGTLERPAPSVEPQQLLEVAFEHRPDLFSRRAGVAEAEARVKLQVADRFGNPTMGAEYELDESRTQFIGPTISVPIPVLNRRKGEIQQHRAQQGQAVIQLQQTEIGIRRDVPAAVAQLTEARAWLANYQKQVLPDLRRGLADIERLFQDGQPGVDVLRVLDVRRKLLRAQDGYLDALLAYTQALAQLATAVGDPAVAMGLYLDGEAPPLSTCPQ